MPWSSTIRTRIGGGADLACMLNRQLGGNARASTRRARYEQSAPDGLRALAHTRHTQLARRARRIWIKPDAVVRGGDPQAVSFELHMYLGARRICVLDHVVEALLNDAERRVLDRRRQAPHRARHLELDHTTIAALKRTQ